ncbi:MAG: MBL fold metallo-hydrolase [Candidatus Fermentibacteraceae bacterium]
MRIRRLTVGPLDVNCYLISGEGRAMAVDPGGDADRVLAALEEDGPELESIVCTHGHFDHVGGCRGLMEATGAGLLVHREAAAGLEEAVEHSLAMTGRPLPPPPAPTGFLADGDTVGPDGLAFRVVHAPGHSPGSICLLGEGILISGDLIFAGSVGRTDLPGGSTELLQRSISEVLRGLDDSVRILPGHGPETTVGRERRTNPFLSGSFL